MPSSNSLAEEASFGGRRGDGAKDGSAVGGVAGGEGDGGSVGENEAGEADDRHMEGSEVAADARRVMRRERSLRSSTTVPVTMVSWRGGESLSLS